MELKLFLIIIHLFGVAIGAGGAYMSDLIFIISARDNHISKTEMKFLVLGSRVVWVGLLILFLSGLGLFFTNPEKYLASTKFLAKITIVLVIFLNGLVFHFFHLKRIHRHVGEYFQFSDEFMRYRPTLLISGAISIISWTSALILGALPSVPYNYPTIMYVYLGLITLASISSLIIFRRLV